MNLQNPEPQYISLVKTVSVFEVKLIRGTGESPNKVFCNGCIYMHLRLFDFYSRHHTKQSLFVCRQQMQSNEGKLLALGFGFPRTHRYYKPDCSL